MFRRKRSKGRREPSTSSASSEVTCSDGGDSSSESYCRYSKSDRRKRDERRGVAKEKSNGKSERKSSLKKGKKSPTGGESGRTESGSGGGVGKKNGKKSEKNRKKEVPPTEVAQQVAAETKSNKEIPKEKLPEVQRDKKHDSLPLSQETPEAPKESELVDAAPTKRDSIEKIAAGVEATEAPPNDKTIVTVADVHTPTTVELDAVLESAEKIVADVELVASNLIVESASTEKPDEKESAPTVTVSVPDESSKQTAAAQSGGENVEQQEAINANDETPSNQTADIEKVESAEATREPTVTFDEKSIEKSADAGDVDSGQLKPSDEKQSADLSAEIDPTSSKPEPSDGEPAQAPNASNTDDASKSFQVLPSGGNESASADNTNQGSEEAGGGLMPPKPATEPIRKTSFTVLKSDESMDDILGVVEDNNNQNAPVKSVKVTLPRPKSFKVLSEMDASGADILLQQSSDQEKSGNEDDDDYLNGNALADQRSGKYSDSELIKFDGNANGRRKKYKKRAKSSVRQLSIVNASTGGGSNQSLNKQQSRDQDSGFEPSPRAMRTTMKPSTKSIYTAPLPERPRVGDVIDSRSCNSRFEQRKPGDKNAVNMSTVSQTLQRNIRRLGDSLDIRRRYEGISISNFSHPLISIRQILHGTQNISASIGIEEFANTFDQSKRTVAGETRR